MAPVFNGDFEDLYSEPVQYRRDGLGTFTRAEDRAHAAHTHKQVAHTHTPAAQTPPPALLPAGITGICDFYSHYAVMSVILSCEYVSENITLFQN